MDSPHENGSTAVLDQLAGWSMNTRNRKLLDALAYAEDMDQADLNVTLERALLLLRGEMLNGPSTVVEVAPAKRQTSRQAQTNYRAKNAIPK